MAAEYKGRDKDASKPSKPGAKKRDKPKRKQSSSGSKTGIRRPMSGLPVGPAGPAQPLFGPGQAMPPPMPPMMPPGY